MQSFSPHFEILPEPQRRLWRELRAAADLGFALYGGTAVALRLGHRTSVDFDFFTDRVLDRTELARQLPFLQNAQVLQEGPDTLTVLASLDEPNVGHGDMLVKLSFFGSIGFGRVAEPQWTSDEIAQVASFDDLLATKVKVLLQRIEAKDYIDIAALLRTGIPLDRGLAAARAMFAPTFQPSECLKALVYFDGGDLDTLTSSTKDFLIEAASSVQDLPQVAVVDRSLTLH
jgi:hypothetical protein